MNKEIRKNRKIQWNLDIEKNKKKLGEYSSKSEFNN